MKRMENFWTKNPINSNRRTVRYYGIKQTQDNTTHEDGKVPISNRGIVRYYGMKHPVP